MAESRTTSSRRGFLTTAMSGATLATSAAVAASGSTVAPAATPASGRPGRLPREVRIATVSQDRLQAETPTQMVSMMLGRMRQAASSRPDLLCLPEVFPVANLRGGRPPLESVSGDPQRHK